MSNPKNAKPKNKRKALATSVFYLDKTKKERRHQAKVQNHITKPQVRLFDTTDEIYQHQYELDRFNAFILQNYDEYVDDICIWDASDELVYGDMDIIHE